MDWQTLRLRLLEQGMSIYLWGLFAYARIVCYAALFLTGATRREEPRCPTK